MQPENAIRVDSTRAEYEYIGQQTCPCGGPYLQPGVRPHLTQSLMFDANRNPFDRLHVQCLKCHTPADFWFDISSFYGKI